ncbi:Transposon TX1 uncharacterized 149 kDa protein [Vitis vinifera]|uniref:Transposon TX1 uncharacterized 149 kDa protein n=1 Tax=Vitis vinifera TaxID=29760 RepID=A0A438EIU1_VITVI|nr:Transposon TX1 uncharacterized 149 kDa protein [Vitis vinifera]
MNSLEFDRIGEEEVARMEEMFSMEEVFLALSELNGDKALGPDGFPLASWHLNTTFLVLVPKKGEADDLCDYRPINLVGGLYKLLTKVLANRLRKVVSKVVSPTLNAFVERRQILDVALIANEAIDSLLKWDESGVLCKLYLEKAYDHINWDFLLTVVQKMGFGVKWVGWIRWCISTASFSILINGSPSSFFQSTRGLRQGDPLSPYLFVLRMEALSCLINRVVRGGFLTVISGLSINLNKSELLPVGRVENVEVLASELGCKVGSLPSTYLGLLLGAPHKSVAVWDGVEERMRKRLALWKRQFISKGGESLSFGARWAVWGLEIFLFSIGPFCANGVGALRLKGSPFGSLLLVGSLGKKVEGGILVRLGRAMGWGFGRKLERKVFCCLKLFPSPWGIVEGDLSRCVGSGLLGFCGGCGGLIPCFSISFNDWEVEVVERLLSTLQGKRLVAGPVSVEHHLEPLCAYKGGLFCLGSFLGEVSNPRSTQEEGLDFSKQVEEVDRSIQRREELQKEVDLMLVCHGCTLNSTSQPRKLPETCHAIIILVVEDPKGLLPCQISQMEERLEEKQQLVLDLQKKSLHIISLRPLNVPRLSLLHFPAENLMTAETGGRIDCCKEAIFTTSVAVDQVKENTERLKSCEQELQTVLGAAMMEIDIVDDVGLRDGILENGRT